MKEKSPLRQKDIRTGAEQERERIIALLETYWDEPCGNPFDPEHCVNCGTMGQLIALIKRDPLKELQQLAEETGEYENFDNPLIDKQEQTTQDLNDLLGIIGK
jgi:hypothetical protein